LLLVVAEDIQFGGGESFVAGLAARLFSCLALGALLLCLLRLGYSFPSESSSLVVLFSKLSTTPENSRLDIQILSLSIW
jgi:hypothetical protein